MDRDSVQLTCSSWRGLRHKTPPSCLRCPQARGGGSPAVRGSFLPFLVKRYTETLHGLQHKDSTPAFLCQQDFKKRLVSMFSTFCTLLWQDVLCEMHHHAFVKRFMKFHEKVFTFWKNHAILKLQNLRTTGNAARFPLIYPLDIETFHEQRSGPHGKTEHRPYYEGCGQGGRVSLGTLSRSSTASRWARNTAKRWSRPSGTGLPPERLCARPEKQPHQYHRRHPATIAHPYFVA